MKKSTSTLTVLFFISLFCNHCKKSTQSPTLPPITETGANTFGCLIDGKVWVPHFTCNYLANPCSEINYSILPADSSAKLPIIFVFMAGNDAGEHSYFNFAPWENSHISTTGNVADSLLISFDGNYGLNVPAFTYSNNLGAGNNVFEITKLDSVNQIISGIFNFTLYAISNSGAVDSIVVTEGRFDLQFGQYCTCSK
jgi:hypothetical protein